MTGSDVTITLTRSEHDAVQVALVRVLGGDQTPLDAAGREALQRVARKLAKARQSQMQRKGRHAAA